jgi:hypothetical protein
VTKDRNSNASFGKAKRDLGSNSVNIGPGSYNVPPLNKGTGIKLTPSQMFKESSKQIKGN